MENPTISPKDEHYRCGNKQLIDVMLEVFHPEEVAIWCKLNVFKYTSRAGRKGLTSEDMRKAAWYASKAQEINQTLEGTKKVSIVIQGGEMKITDSNKDNKNESNRR